MTHLNLMDTGGRLARLDAACDRLMAEARRPTSEYRAAYQAMYREQGFSDCDVCGKLATFQWQRTTAQLKKMMGRKIKGARAEALPVSWRCYLHVPVAFPELAQEYRDARVVRVSAEAVS